MCAPLLTLDGLRVRFARRPETLLEVADDIAARFASIGDALVPAALPEAARALLARCPDPSALPLWGMPYVVGANVDVAGLPTSAGLPALDFLPDFDATVVERLRAAGALVVGKAPVDPLGLDASAAGIAVAIATGLAAFGIASDRTGAASMDAASCGVVAIKPSPGCVTIDGLFAVTPGFDGVVVLAADVVSGTAVRRVIESDGVAQPRLAASPTRLGLLGDDASALAPDIAEQLGLALVFVDKAPFAEIVALMDDDAWLALRLEDVEVALLETPDLFPAHLRQRLSRALGCPARDLVQAQRRLSGLCRQVEAVFAGFDLLFVPPDAGLAGFINTCGLAAVILPDGTALIGAHGSDDGLADAAIALMPPAFSKSTRPIDILASSTLAHR